MVFKPLQEDCVISILRISSSYTL